MNSIFISFLCNNAFWTKTEIFAIGIFPFFFAFVCSDCGYKFYAVCFALILRIAVARECTKTNGM